MNGLSLIYYRIKSVGLYRETAENEAVCSLMKMIEAANSKDLDRLFDGWGQLVCQLYQSGETSLSDLIYSLLLKDNNAFSRACAKGAAADEYIRTAQSEISAFAELSRITAQEILDAADVPCELSDRLVPWTNGEKFSCTADETLISLRDYYAENGCGIFSQYRAFVWQNGGLVPVEAPDTITFADLKGYVSQRKALVDNTLAFLGNRPCNNVLLYGDRGTGKSSSVHALLNEYYKDGLRMIELSKADIADFHRVSSMIAKIPLKFIVFIDDLSFSHDNDSFAGLKAALEGGLAAKPSNMLIYATTNRRHLIKETFDSRKGEELHVNDSIQEELSLSDRFGIVITFINPDRKQFYDIVDAMAKDRGLDITAEELHFLAERWSLSKGGRSPRGARQFIDSLCSNGEKGEN